MQMVNENGVKVPGFSISLVGVNLSKTLVKDGEVQQSDEVNLDSNLVHGFD